MTPDGIHLTHEDHAGGEMYPHDDPTALETTPGKPRALIFRCGCGIRVSVDGAEGRVATIARSGLGARALLAGRARQLAEELYAHARKARATEEPSPSPPPWEPGHRRDTGWRNEAQELFGGRLREIRIRLDALDPPIAASEELTGYILSYSVNPLAMESCANELSALSHLLLEP